MQPLDQPCHSEHHVSVIAGAVITILLSFIVNPCLLPSGPFLSFQGREIHGRY